MDGLTNCKRIHMMNCEELAQFLLKEFVDGYCDNCPAYYKFCRDDPNYFYNPESLNCQEIMVKWLESEAE